MQKLVEEMVHEGEKIKGSRFIVSLFPIETEVDSKIFLTKVRKEHPKAGHHCYAWRLLSGKSKSSDDGEPSGSGGLPILRRIEHLDIVDVLVVVTRYFGGVKLGVGGLVRAYGNTAQQGLSMGKFATISKTAKLSLQCTYADSNVVKVILRTVEDLQLQVIYGEQVVIKAELPLTQMESIKKTLISRTSGRVNFK